MAQWNTVNVWGIWTTSVRTLCPEDPSASSQTDGEYQLWLDFQVCALLFRFGGSRSHFLSYSSAASSGGDDELWPALTLPGVTYAHINIYTECLSDANDNEAVDVEHFEEDLSQSPAITENDPLLKKKKG